MARGSPSGHSSLIRVHFCVHFFLMCFRRHYSYLGVRLDPSVFQHEKQRFYGMSLRRTLSIAQDTHSNRFVTVFRFCLSIWTEETIAVFVKQVTLWRSYAGCFPPFADRSHGSRSSGLSAALSSIPLRRNPVCKCCCSSLLATCCLSIRRFKPAPRVASENEPAETEKRGAKRVFVAGSYR